MRLVCLGMKCKLQGEVSPTPTSTTSVIQSWSCNHFSLQSGMAASSLQELLEGLLLRSNSFQLHRSKWKSITSSRHKLCQLFPALRNLLLLPAAENRMLNKRKTSQPGRDACLQWHTVLCSLIPLQWQCGVAMTILLISTCKPLYLQSSFIGII